MISKINEILELDDSCIKSGLAYIDPITLSNIVNSIKDKEVINKISKNLSEETKKNMSLHQRAFDESINPEEATKQFIAILNRVLNFR